MVRITRFARSMILKLINQAGATSKLVIYLRNIAIRVPPEDSSDTQIDLVDYSLSQVLFWAVTRFIHQNKPPKSCIRLLYPA